MVTFSSMFGTLSFLYLFVLFLVFVSNANILDEPAAPHIEGCTAHELLLNELINRYLLFCIFLFLNFRLI